MSKKSVKQPDMKVADIKANNYLSKIEDELKSNQSKVSMVLGVLIILIIGILISNYFSKGKPTLGPAQQVQQTTQEDVPLDNLPGKYTVKDGDTLFEIADKYYKDGYKYTEIAKTNNMSDVDVIVVGQVIEIPKLTEEIAMINPTPSSFASMEASPTPNTISDLGTGGGNTTIWGTKIEDKTYTVTEGDWLSKIAERAYGDVFLFEKIAKANNITNPDLIEPGTVLTIPR